MADDKKNVGGVGGGERLFTINYHDLFCQIGTSIVHNRWILGWIRQLISKEN